MNITALLGLTFGLPLALIELLTIFLGALFAGYNFVLQIMSHEYIFAAISGLALLTCTALIAAIGYQ